MRHQIEMNEHHYIQNTLFFHLSSHRLHPDKRLSPGCQRGKAADNLVVDVTEGKPFDKIIEAYHFLLHDLDNDDGSSSSTSTFHRDRKSLRDQLVQVLDMAIRGAPLQQIEELLLQLGQHRPNQGFGYAPYPPFTHSTERLDIAITDSWRVEEEGEEKVAAPETPTLPFPRSQEPTKHRQVLI